MRSSRAWPAAAAAPRPPARRPRRRSPPRRRATSTQAASTAGSTTSTKTVTAPHEINRRKSPTKLPASPADFTKAALTTATPSLACSAYTEEALAKAYGGQPGCEAAIRSGGAADSVAVKGVYTSPDSARLLVVPAGGPSDGEKVKVTLVKQGGSWRISSLHANVPVGP